MNVFISLPLGIFFLLFLLSFCSIKVPVNSREVKLVGDAGGGWDIALRR